MSSSTAQARAGFSLSPLMVIGVIFVALVAIEGLLAARFWLQLATASASDGINRFVLDVSQPLVAPFSDAGSAAEKEVGAFERNTLLAAMAYLLGAVGLVVLTIVGGGLASGNQAMARRHRRSSLQQLDHPLADHTSARLLGTATLAISPQQATRALKMLGLDKLDTQIYVIPAAGGCIVAALEAGAEEGHASFLSRLGSRRETATVMRAMREIESRFAPGAVEAAGAS